MQKSSDFLLDLLPQLVNERLTNRQIIEQARQCSQHVTIVFTFLDLLLALKQT